MSKSKKKKTTTAATKTGTTSVKNKTAVKAKVKTQPKTPSKPKKQTLAMLDQNDRIAMQNLINSSACIFDTNMHNKLRNDIHNLINYIYKNIDKNNPVKLWVDGSYNQTTRKAGIGIVIKSTDSGKFDQKNNIAFGKTINVEDSVAAEIYAMSIGLSFVMDTFKNCKNIHIYYDCSSIMTCASNIDAFTQHGAPYTNFKSALKRLKKNRINTAFEHTKAHENDANNNLCDQIARHYSGSKLNSDDINRLKQLKAI